MDKWYAENARLRSIYPSQWIRLFAFDQDAVVNEMLSGYNALTFPKDIRWRDQHGTIWHRAGLYVFDFKQDHLERPKAVPSGRVILTRISSGCKVQLFCEIQRAFFNNRANIGENIAVGNDKPIYSSSCGRAVLKLIHRANIIGRFRPRKRKVRKNVKEAEEDAEKKNKMNEESQSDT